MIDSPLTNPIRRVATGLMVLILLAATGCDNNEVFDGYGRRHGREYSTSVNGTTILANMFTEKGFRVSSAENFSPRLERAQVLVWFPNDFDVPTQMVQMSMWEWLSGAKGRTFIYVGRDFDSAPLYWTKVLDTYPPEQGIEAARRAAMAEADYEFERTIQETGATDWFVLKEDKPGRPVRTLTGPWSDGIDASAIEISLRRRLMFPAGPAKPSENSWDTSDRLTYESLLSSEGDDLVFRVRSSAWNSNQLIVVANGSFLLNCPLVNREHQKLADKLVSACGTPAKVVFLESEAGGPRIVDTEDVAKQPTGFEMLTTFPLGAIVMHVFVLGIVACCVFFPIFGRPRTAERDAAVRATDFSVHLDALGEMLEQSKNEDFARSQIASYRRKD